MEIFMESGVRVWRAGAAGEMTDNITQNTDIPFRFSGAYFDPYGLRADVSG
jgi:hypothetical protein